MRRLSLTCFVAAVMAASGAYAQNAAQPADTGQAPSSTQSHSSTQPQPDSTAAPAAQSTGAMKSHQRRPGPTSGNQVQDPSPDTPAQRHSPPSAQSQTETRPDARYPHPSGQDSQSDNSSHKTKLAAAGSKKDKESGHEQTPEATRQSKQATQLGKQKTYTQSSGSKADSSTACSTARPTVDGGVDCGTSGNSATMGKIVTKPH